MRLRSLALLLWCGVAVAGTPVATLRLCTLDKPFPPYTMPDGSGQTQELLRRAAKALSLAVSNITAPRARCLAYLESGTVDGLVASYLPERMKLGRFPMNDEGADPARALGYPRFLVYRQRGSAVQWDGKAFTGLDGKPVGVQYGFVMGPMLKALGVAADDGAMTTEQNLGKLALGRVSAAVALENEAQPLIAKAFAGKVEPLAVPFVISPLYLQVSHGYYQQHEEAVEALWATIRRVRESPSFKKYLEQKR